MTFIKYLEDIKRLCRICLISSDNMISLENNLDEKCDDSPLIVDVLENLLMVEVDTNTDYPVEICHICRGNLKIIYDLKVIFNKSQNILKKCVSTLEHIDKDDPLQDNETLVKSTDSLHEEMILADTDDVKDDIKDLEQLTENATLHVEDKKPNVKLQISPKKKTNVTVKWLEGNRFIIEKNEEDRPTVNKCKHCRKVFSSKEKYSNHLISCKKNISCRFCKSKFFSERSLRCHLKVAHDSTVPAEIKCDVCDKTFKNYNARSYHKITRHNTEGKKHTCELCGKAFFFKNSLSQHLECHSRDVSRVVCPICGKSFHYRGGLFYHMKIHRNERNYVCSICNGKFLNMASLKRHTRIHTGERPYTCIYCPKNFCSISEVRTHERRHTGQKPHQCKYCGKRFLTPYNLKLHTSSHIGAEPCEICGKSYLNAEVLKYHMDIKHNIRDQVGLEVVV